jgi:hypothetical protein
MIVNGGVDIYFPFLYITFVRPTDDHQNYEICNIPFTFDSSLMKRGFIDKLLHRRDFVRVRRSDIRGAVDADAVPSHNPPELRRGAVPDHGKIVQPSCGFPGCRVLPEHAEVRADFVHWKAIRDEVEGQIAAVIAEEALDSELDHVGNQSTSTTPSGSPTTSSRSTCAPDARSRHTADANGAVIPRDLSSQRTHISVGTAAIAPSSMRTARGMGKLGWP